MLTGCSVREDNATILKKRYPQVDLFLRPDQEPELTARLGLAGATAPGRLGADAAPRRQSATSAWLPIIYGCDKTCTYCIVPFSRGPERSRSFDEVLDEARSLAAAGYREVTLLGQNVNSYGHDLAVDDRFADVHRSREIGRRIDLDGRPDIATLLRAIDDLRTADGVPAIPRVRFVTSHPWDLSDRLIAAMAECAIGVRAPAPAHPVGRRRGTAAHGPPVHDRRVPAAGRASCARPCPGSRLTTDIIVGFCGETEQQFENTLNVLREVRFEQVFAAAFSPRPGTPAARMADDVPKADKKRRLNTLLSTPGGHRPGSEQALARPNDRRARRPGQAAVDARWRRQPADGRPQPAQQAGPLRRRAGADGAHRRCSHRARRSVRAARHSPRLTLAFRRSSSSAARRLPARPACRWRSASASLAPRSSAPIRARSIAAWTSATAKVSAAERALVPHHGLDLVDPDESVHRGRLPAGSLRGSGGYCATRTAWRCWSAGRACTCAPWRAAFHSRKRAAIRRSVPRSRQDWRGRGCMCWWLSSDRSAPVVARTTDLANPRRVVRALERVSVRRRPTAAPAARLSRAFDVDRPRARSSGERTAYQRPGPRPVRKRAARRSGGAARALRREPVRRSVPSAIARRSTRSTVV